ncbi:MAG: adenylate/guanylate cyclase domain-containing protein [Betaproteobacteria bacterium]|nr:adenylate/guanylate cyclase domain-containing protein [Betaproteobacteria bacterium]
MDPTRQTTVLFADVSGSTKLYESAGDATAMEAIELCLGRLRQVSESFGGRIVKTIGDEIMVLFPSPDSAAGASADMQHAIDELPTVANMKLGVRIGFQFGPVMQREDDVFGDTVNLAARLVGQAGKGQIITSNETMELLGPIYKAWTRRLYSIQVKGKTSEVELCEVLWRQGADTTALLTNRPGARAKLTVLRLKYRDQEIVRRRDQESITIGRDQTAGLAIADTMASRLHCTIERRQGKFVLADHSTNGTYVTAEGDAEILLQREEFTLGKHGWIACGQPRAATTEVIEYFGD